MHTTARNRFIGVALILALGLTGSLSAAAKGTTTPQKPKGGSCVGAINMCCLTGATNRLRPKVTVQRKTMTRVRPQARVQKKTTAPQKPKGGSCVGAIDMCCLTGATNRLRPKARVQTKTTTQVRQRTRVQKKTTTPSTNAVDMNCLTTNADRIRPKASR